MHVTTGNLIGLETASVRSSSTMKSADTMEATAVTRKQSATLSAVTAMKTASVTHLVSRSAMLALATIGLLPETESAMVMPTLPNATTMEVTAAMQTTSATFVLAAMSVSVNQLETR